ncbi:MAG: SMP-30/gluconolactonase/LRE family protein [Myxococcales bacterium]|nr:SMP-30/gluconolactonase/LRE family protein [Myxococcales bacterium]
MNVLYGPDNKLYVADFDNDLIRVVDTETGDTSTLIKQQKFERPFALAWGKDGTLWISTDNNGSGQHSLMTGSIWRVNPGAKAATLVTQNIGRPRGMAVLPDGRLALSDYMHHVVELFNPADQSLTVLAGAWDAKGMVDGAGAAARFSTPYHLVLRQDGKLLVADFDNHRLRIVGLDGSVSTFSGGGAGFVDGAMTEARWNLPQGVAIAANGDIYVTDLGNYRLRVIKGNTVETVAGSGTGGYKDSDDRLDAQLYGLEGLSLKPDASEIYLADGGRGFPKPFNSIRVVNNQ